MRRHHFAVVAVALLALLAVPSSSFARSCGRVGIRPNTDNVARDIQATNMTCRLARRVVIDHRRHGIRNPRGFRCTKRQVGEEGIMGYLSITCTKGEKRVRWKN